MINKKKVLKKEFLLTLGVGLLLLASIGGVLAKDIAYIAKDTSKVDNVVLSLLENANYTYDIIYQTGLASTDFSRYRIILVGDGMFSDPSKIPVNSKNAVIMNTYHMDEWLWTENSVSVKSSNYPTSINVYDEGSSIVLGVESEFIPYDSVGSLSSYDIKYISKSLDAPGLKTIVADGLSLVKYLGIYIPKNGAVVATIENGSMLRGNQISKARGVFLGFTNTELWTEDTKTIFYNSIEWAINGEDRDEDGFFSDEDCNDNDASINPDIEEIPYDGIDQDCSGGDLNDLDKDGFAGEEAGGDDCDDNDPEYNVNSSDLSKNCINDAPIINSLNRISVHETEVGVVIIDAYDPEGDEIIYEVNDTRFVQDYIEENIFRWTTDYEDAGDYKFLVIVGDGEKQSQEQLIVKVWNKNKAPELLMDIPEQEWEEDNNHTINLTEYFYDLDGDSLIYLFHDSSENTNIRLKKIENGIVYLDSKKDWYGEDWIIFKASDGINVQETNNITLRVLPVNDGPELIEELESINIDEDEIYYLDLSEYIYDSEDEIEYSAEDTPHISLSVDGNILEIIPQKDWYGEEEATITADDGEFVISQNFTIRVISVNDAPEVSSIEEQFLLAGGEAIVIGDAIDVEGDFFTFLVNDTRFVQDDIEENIFRWYTGENDFGNYLFRMSAYDGKNYGVMDFKINVFQKIFINELVWGEEGWVELYNSENIPFRLEECVLKNGEEEIGLYGTLGNRGFMTFDWGALDNTGYVELRCNNVLMDYVEYPEFNNENSLGRKTDGFEDDTLEESDSFKIFYYPTKGVSNSADVTNPEVELISPTNNTLYTQTREVLFEFTGVDNFAEEMECSIIANSKELEKNTFENNTLGSFYIDYLKDGVYIWNVECSDGFNKNTALESWMITISAPDNPILSYIGNKVTVENTELRFSIYATDPDRDTIHLIIDGLPEGASFTEEGSGRGVFAWTPNYNQSGSYNVNFTAEDSTGLKDSESINILVGDAKEPPKFSDVDRCSKEDKNDSIILTIKEPDEGDEFEIGEVIDGTLKIKNEFEDDVDFDVKIYLYDIKEEEVVEEFKDSIEIKDGKSGDIEFSIDIPKDIENTEYAIYAYVEGEDDTCNSAYVEIEINRKKHEVVIADIITDRGEVSPGEEVEVKVKAENLGRSDEDIYITVEIPSLNISKKSDEIEIEKFGDEDKETETFYLTIPQSAQYGYYDIKARVIYDDGEDTRFKDLIITGSTNSVNDTTPKNTTEVKESRVINLNPGSSKGTSNGGTPLVLVNSGSKSNTGKNQSETTQVIYAKSPSKSLGSILKESNQDISFGISEKVTKEYNPKLKMEFDNGGKRIRIPENQWVLLSIVLGLLVIVIFILIIILR